jgi:hypothetical protein
MPPAICENKFPNTGHSPPKYPLGENEPRLTGSSQSWLSLADFAVITASAYKRHLSLVGDNWDNDPNCDEWHGGCLEESARWERSPNQIKADLDECGIEQRRWAEERLKDWKKRPMFNQNTNANNQTPKQKEN